MNSSRTIRTSRPMKGLAVFVRAVEMAAPHLGLPASHQGLDRDEDPSHPGEGRVDT